MIAVFLRARRDVQQLRGRHAVLRREAAHRELAARERAGFVEDEGVDLRRQFNVRDVLDQNAEARGGGKRGHHRRRRGEHERARAGHDEHRDDAAQILREGPHQRADDQHQRRVENHVLIHDAHDGQPGFFGGENQFAHAAQRRVRARAAHFDFENAGQVLRAGENVVAGFLVHRQRFAGDVRLIETALARDDHAVRRHVVAGANANHVADGEVLHRDFLLRAAAQAAALWWA